jgi:hypothetical protein
MYSIGATRLGRWPTTASRFAAKQNPNGISPIELTTTHPTCTAGSCSPRHWSAMLLLAVASTLAACGSADGDTLDGDTSPSGATAILVWDPSPSSDVVGYRIYYGTAPGAYSQGVDVGNSSTLTVAGLTGPTTYYFAATAYDAFGHESAYSNEVSKAIP